MAGESALLGEHVQYLRDSRYSEATIRERTRIVSSLPSLVDLDRAAVQQWQQGRQVRPDGAPRAAGSLSGEASHVRDFWRWCRTQGHLDHNPADWLHKVRTTSTKAVTVSEGDMHRLMDEAPEDVRRMIALTGMAGLRSSEAAAIRWEDLDYANETLWVRDGKGGKDRAVPLSGGLLAALGNPGTGPTEEGAQRRVVRAQRPASPVVGGDPRGEATAVDGQRVDALAGQRVDGGHAGAHRRVGRAPGAQPRLVFRCQRVIHALHA